MVEIHSLGFTRSNLGGSTRELVEKYWDEKISPKDFYLTFDKIQSEAWSSQSIGKVVPVNDLPLYDHVLDMSFLLGNMPKMDRQKSLEFYDIYKYVVRGVDIENGLAKPAKTAKLFNTNYEYIVPELIINTSFKLNTSLLKRQINMAAKKGIRYKPVIIGPMTYLSLCELKVTALNKLWFLKGLTAIYKELLDFCETMGVEWVQIDEPILNNYLDHTWINAFETVYKELNQANVKIMLATYFGKLDTNLMTACTLGTDGVHFEVLESQKEIQKAIEFLPSKAVLSLGVIDGKSEGKAPILDILEWLEPLAVQLQDRLWIAPSCSMMYILADLEDSHEKCIKENNLANKKLDELLILKRALNEGRESVHKFL